MVRKADNWGMPPSEKEDWKGGTGQAEKGPFNYLGNNAKLLTSGPTSVLSLVLVMSSLGGAMIPQNHDSADLW